MEDFSSDTEDGPTKFRRARWLLAVVALLVVAAMIFMRVTALPKYEGKPISHYLKNLKRSSRSGVYLTAVKAVEAVGSDALAY